SIAYDTLLPLRFSFFGFEYQELTNTVGSNGEPLFFNYDRDILPTVAPAVAGVTIHFRTWDVDDPFDQNNPDMPNKELIDNDTSGPDNRGPEPGVGQWSAVTDAFGKASVTVTVSMQPGNNYRGGASCDQAAINAATQTQADSNAPPNDVLFSEMLTIWRKLWIEVDSMAAVDSTNTQTGTVQAAPTFDPANNHAIIDINDLETDFEKTDQHKFGRIDISGFGSFTTIHTIVSLGDDQVEILNAPPTIVTANEAEYTLWDDDVGGVPVPPGPPVTLPRAPDTVLMADLYEPAYVAAQNPNMGFYDSNTPFDRNVNSPSEIQNSGNANRDLTSSASYWVVHLTSAFQGFRDKDCDPGVEMGEEGVTMGVTAEGGGATSGSLIFLEAIRDRHNGIPGSMVQEEQVTVVHESGHQFLLQHSDGYSPPPGHDGDYIMTDDVLEAQPPDNIAFSATSLNKIRLITHPPQGG
ncbi:MAG: hypothetical protein IID34_08795, partial [Planctomycetes bacterium]|nr:hypothetical protein [Planctomycetota bacterium]